MTESEAIREFQRNIDLPFGSNISKEATKLAIQALEEIQQYREIGTVEECQMARDKQKESKKKMSKRGDNRLWKNQKSFWIRKKDIKKLKS